MPDFVNKTIPLADLRTDKEKVNYLVRECFKLFCDQYDIGKADITKSGSIEFICPVSFKAYYLMSNDLRNLDYEVYQHLHKVLTLSFEIRE